MLQECAPRVFQECYKECNTSVTRALQEWYKSVTRGYQSVTRVLQKCHKSVTRVLQECYKSVTRVLQVYLVVRVPPAELGFRL
jgi:hypothetical protein